MTANRRGAIGIWAQWPKDARWSNEGMTRLLGFLIEGIAQSGNYVFRVVLPDDIRDAAENDLGTLNAVLGRDYTLHSPRDASVESDSFSSLAAFANGHVPVEAWLSLFPNFSIATHLEAPVTVIFPDAIPKAFHSFDDRAWGPEGYHLRWANDVRELLSSAAGVVTFSDHVAREQVAGLFGFPSERTTICPHAAPDLGPLLPFVEAGRRTSGSIAKAADLLRRECSARGSRYLADFPFEQVAYVAVSTQDRVTKNIQLVARALDVLLRERRKDIKVLTTAPLHFSEHWAVLPQVVEERLSQFDLVSIPDLPRDVHASFLHCAAMVVHPSIFEGGHAPFPFYEAVSVGTPCIMAKGPHIEELAVSEPGIRDFCFDPNDSDGLANMICDVLDRRAEALHAQLEIYRRLQRNNWASVAAIYAEAAISGASLPKASDRP